MSVDTTCCTVVALDKAGQPLRPALLWMDMRSAKYATMVAASQDEALQVRGVCVDPSVSGCLSWFTKINYDCY